MKKILISIFSAMLLGCISLFAQTTPDKDYLCFTATGASSVTLNKVSNPTEVALETSKDGTSWSDYTIGTAIELADGDKVYFRNKSKTPATSFSTEDYSKGSHYKFAMTGSIAASGNVMSLIDQNCSITDISAESYKCCFFELFKDCTSLTAAPKLPATKLVRSCYYYMFSGCTGLKTAPELPAMTLASSCYSDMFSGCTELVTAPELPATTLAEECYTKLFKDCTKLNYVKVGFTAWYNEVTGNMDWLRNAGMQATDKVFVCSADLDIQRRNDGHLPSGWSVTYIITANQDPDNKENYYATFCCPDAAYKLPNNVSAYYGKIKDGKLNLFKIEGDIIPADVGVILKASTNEIPLIQTDETGTAPDENALNGSSKIPNVPFSYVSKAPEGTKVLSLGESGVGFYLWEGKPISAHKAFILAATQQ